MSAQNVKIEEGWRKALQQEFDAPYFLALKQFLQTELCTPDVLIFPPNSQILNAFNFTPFSEVKVVILGQDPYHNFGQAHGLSFSVPDGVPFPKSLINIFKELQSDLQVPYPTSGNLTRWAAKGVLLLNATLTVRAHQAGSHQNKGWETFTDAVIKKISDEKENVVFLLWGNYARAKANLINAEKHLILEAAHPSPLSAHRGFFGCRHFSQTNQYLEKIGKTSIQW